MKYDVKIKKEDILLFNKMIRDAEKKSVKFANRMVKNIALRFFISARVHTGPGKRGEVSKLDKKHRIRPVVNLTMDMQHRTGKYWYHDRVKGTMFSRPSPISKKSRFKSTIDFGPIIDSDPHARIVPVKRAIKAYSKKKRKFVYIGTNLPKGLHEKNRKTAIPGAGAAKAGWIMGMKNLGNNKGTGIGRISSRVGTTKWHKGKNPFIKHINEVDYVSNISPGVVSISMNKAANWFRAKEKYKFEKMIHNI